MLKVTLDSIFKVESRSRSNDTLRGKGSFTIDSRLDFQLIANLYTSLHFIPIMRSYNYFARIGLDYLNSNEA